jgi:lipopolysaccharide transport system ATP-binding protein
MSSKIQIEIENLGKEYKLGAYGSGGYQGYSFFGFPLPFQRLWPILADHKHREKIASSNSFWALKDFNLDISEGEVLGIVGKNGSGKSTLLKILARVTEPTTGRALVRGQVGSLLEVGTGFHGELTGRQNVYLNGSIMGMSREQIDRKFDEIVDFAEVSDFIDTPVKHYSSGMYMRLAFSVAANMECQVLIVDEVLAVGDIHFQRKCLGRMNDEVKSGKTVLFVSHNTSMVMQVCTKCILMDRGTLLAQGSPQAIVEQYISKDMQIHSERMWNVANAPYSPERDFRMWSIRLFNKNGDQETRFDVKEPIIVEMVWDSLTGKYPINVHIYVWHESGVCAFVSMDNLSSPWQESPAKRGRYKTYCEIPSELLNEGMYTIEYLLCTRPTTTEYVTVKDAVSFYVIDDMENLGVRGNWSREWFASVFRPRLGWQHMSPEFLEEAR